MKILLVGAGGYASGYVKSLLAPIEDVTWEGIVDPYWESSKVKDLIVSSGVPIYDTMEAFYRTHTADLAVICTPPFLHRAQCLTALENGSYVLCEKPIAPTEEEAKAMRDAEKRHGKWIAVGYQWSFSDAIAGLKRDILGGVLGAPISMKTAISWPRSRAYYGRGTGWGGRLERDGVKILDSIASNACAHYLHNMLFLLGDGMDTAAEVDSLAGECYRANAIESFDTCALRMTAKGVPLYFIASHAAEEKRNPEFVYTFENAVVTFSEDGDSMIRAVFTDGREICYGNPFESSFKKLWDCVRAVTAGETPICTAETASAHTRLIGLLHETLPIRDFPAESIYTNGDYVYVKGLYNGMYRAYAEMKLLSEVSTEEDAMDADRRYVTYEQFGARGDGVTDDMEAIVRCHAYANAHGLPVKGRDGANYYIGGKAISAEIRTDVDWGGAHFTIDDRAVENREVSCFIVQPDRERFTPEIGSLKKGQKRVDFPHEGSVYVRVYDDTRRLYIRKGLNQNNGTAACDAFVVDGSGNVTGEINWDYDRITSALAISVDDRPITLTGGVFTTVANEAPSFYTYYARNIQIRRAHVTVKGLTYLVTNEGDHGAPYKAFLSLMEAYDCELRDCLMTPHFIYYTASKIPGQTVAMGTYGISAHASIVCRFIGIRQTIDITDTRYWGLMGSNFSKEILLQDCVISRFDAHMGVTNGTVRGCTLGHQGINLIGFGEFLVEDTTLYCGHFLNFRSDYGAFFHGKLTVRGCTWIPTRRKEERLYLFRGRNEQDHDFGYACALPEEIGIEDFCIRDGETEGDFDYSVFYRYDGEYSEGKPYPLGTPKRVTAEITVESGRAVMMTDDERLYPRHTDYTLKVRAFK